MRFSPSIAGTAVFVVLGFAAAPAFAVLPKVSDPGAASAISSQSLRVSDNAPLSPPSRDSFSVKVYEIIGWPCVSRNTSTPFGSGHKGTDYVPGEGTPIFSVAGGTVLFAGADGSGYGNMVLVSSIVDGVPTQFRYAHMQNDSMTVSVGDTVSVGSPLGAVGSTGRSTGPHLHFEVLVNGILVDPPTWLSAHVNIDTWRG